MEFLVVLACVAGKGCEDTAHAFYLSDPVFRSEIEYAQYQIEAKTSKRTLVALSSGALFLSGRNWTYQLSQNLILKGARKWDDLSLSYQFYF